jgi:hypothetical protein
MKTVHRTSAAVAASEPLLARLSALAAPVLSGPGLPALFIATYGLAYALRCPLLKWYPIPHMTFQNILPHPFLAAASLVATALVLVLLCWRMWGLAQTLPRQSTLPLILAGWLGASACAVLTFPGQSTDMGDYIFRAHMLAHLGRNPLTTPPSDVVAWKQFLYLSWYYEPDSYGPLWQEFSAGLHALAGEDLLTNFLAYKLLAVAATGLSGWLICAILARRAPGYAAAGLALWLWNPVVLNERAMHGHNDFAMVPLMLGGIALLLRGDETGGAGRRSTVLRATCLDVAGLLLLTAAGLIKANIWILLPAAAAWLAWRRGLIRAAIAAGAALLCGALWSGWPTGRSADGNSR